MVYLPPDRVRDSVLIDAHTRSLNTVLARSNPADEIIVLGDFNLPGLKWLSSTSGCLYPDPGLSTFHFGALSILDSYSSAALRQVNNVRNENDRILDLCFVNAHSKVTKISSALTPLVNNVPHHPPLHLVLDGGPALDEICRDPVVTYNFRKADYDSIISVLNSIDWSQVLDNANVDAATETFTHIIGYLIDRHVPKKTVECSARLPWFTPELRRLKATKRTALKRYSKYRTLVLRDHYTKLNHEYKTLSKRCFSRYQNRIQRQLKTDPKAFWKFIRNQRKEPDLPSTIIYNDEVGANPEEICKLFASKCSSVFANEILSLGQIDLATANVPEGNVMLGDLIVQNENILTAMRKLKSSLTPGPDGIPAIVLKKCIPGLLQPLRHLFQLSLSTGTFPSFWKSAFVFPVYKKGDKSNAENYRGISSLNALSKLFELLVMNHISFGCQRTISDDQHGFMPNRSTSTNLLTLTSFISEGFEKGHQTDVIYTDLSAAFDKINHRIAIAKLKKIGIAGPLLKWFESYLVDRRLSVKIGTTYSASFPVSSGIPQGSHLGPMIFLIYFNDANIALRGPRLSFADDLKIFALVTKLEDAQALQAQLDIFNKWCVNNRMS